MSVAKENILKQVQYAMKLLKQGQTQKAYDALEFLEQGLKI